MEKLAVARLDDNSVSEVVKHNRCNNVELHTRIKGENIYRSESHILEHNSSKNTRFMCKRQEKIGIRNVIVVHAIATKHILMCGIVVVVSQKDAEIYGYILYAPTGYTYSIQLKLEINCSYADGTISKYKILN